MGPILSFKIYVTVQALDSKLLQILQLLGAHFNTRSLRISFQSSHLTKVGGKLVLLSNLYIGHDSLEHQL